MYVPKKSGKRTFKTLGPALDRVLRREQLAEAIAGDGPCRGLLGVMGVIGEHPIGLGSNIGDGPGAEMKTKGKRMVKQWWTVWYVS